MSPAVSLRRPLPRAIDTLSSAGLAIWLLADALRSFWIAYERTGWPRANAALLGGVFLASAWFVARRSPAPASPVSAVRRGAIVLSLCVPLAYGFVRVTPARTDAWLALVVWISTALLAWSTFSLRSNFSVFPQVRSLVDSGPYAFVRHPLYASYLLVDLTYWLGSPDPLAGLIWALEAGLLYLRAGWEEAVWSDSPDYRAYRTRVRWRLIPGVL
jgi:protein-S-isoprenylcysteine O-methyltransferase Ste14